MRWPHSQTTPLLSFPDQLVIQLKVLCWYRKISGWLSKNATLNFKLTNRIQQTCPVCRMRLVNSHFSIAFLWKTNFKFTVHVPFLTRQSIQYCFSKHCIHIYQLISFPSAHTTTLIHAPHTSLQTDSIVLVTEIQVFTFPHNPKLLSTIQTNANPRGNDVIVTCQSYYCHVIITSTSPYSKVSFLVTCRPV